MIETSIEDAGNNLPKYLRVKDILEMIPVSDTTVYNWVKAGKLTPKKITTGTVVYEYQEVMSLINHVD